MPWTDSRSREEWLAEVQRRGTRIRRRRRFGFGVVGALALVLPVSVTASVLSDGAERAVELSAAGPAPAGDLVPAPAPPNELATGEVPAAATVEEAPTTTLAEVHDRVARINGVPVPGSSPTSVPPADDPVVGRSGTTTTIATSGNTSSPVQGGALSDQGGATSASLGPAPAPCVADEFTLTVSVDKDTYGRGETVRGSSILEKRSAGICLLPDWWLEISLLNAAGSDASQFAGSSSSVSTANQREKWVDPCRPGDCPRPVEPGAVFSHTFAWEMVDCTNVSPVIPVPPVRDNCVPFPPGTYTVVADWNGPGGGAPARTTLQLGA